jgi:ankyrin repeat protein
LDLRADVNGFSPKVYNNRRDIPLINACKKGFEAIVELLLAYSADTLNPILEFAAEQGNLYIVQKLLDYRAEFGEAMLAAAAKG